jgi:hypothetical protein
MSVVKNPVVPPAAPKCKFKKRYVVLGLLAVPFVAGMFLEDNTINVSNTVVSTDLIYDMNNPAHREDMICIAALGVRRDILFGKYNMDGKKNEVELRKLTDKQNTLILKYAYSSQLNQHVEVRKMFLLQTEGNQYITDLIKKCS